MNTFAIELVLDGVSSQLQLFERDDHALQLSWWSGRDDLPRLCDLGLLRYEAGCYVATIVLAMIARSELTLRRTHP